MPTQVLSVILGGSVTTCYYESIPGLLPSVDAQLYFYLNLSHSPSRAANISPHVL